jgi:WD40 repeat protein
VRNPYIGARTDDPDDASTTPVWYLSMNDRPASQAQVRLLSNLATQESDSTPAGRPVVSTEEIRKDGLVARAVDWVFGYDFFISYNHGDGPKLPLYLKERLTQAGFRVFLDQTEYVAGLDLRRETRRQVVKSRKLVVIARPGALRSVWVKREVDVAFGHGKIPIIVNVNGAIEAAQDSALAAMALDQNWLRLEARLDDPDGELSGTLVGELVRGFNHTRQETKRRRVFAAAAAILAVTAGIAIWQAIEATRVRIVAEIQRDRALRNESVSLTELSNTARNDGRPVDAVLLALAAWPREGDDRRPELRSTINRLVDALSVIQERIRFTRHNAPVRAAAFSTDGRRVITESDDEKVLIWDAATGKVMQTIEVRAKVNSAAFNQDGSRVITASEDGTASIWDVETGDRIKIFERHGGSLLSAAFSPDGSRIVTASDDRTARILDVTSGKDVATLNGHTGKVYSAKFSPDGSRIVTASQDHTARIWDISKPSHYKKLKGQLLKGHTDEVYSAAFSWDSKRIVTASEDSTTIIWDARRRTIFSKLKPRDDDPIKSAEFDRAGSRVATGSADYDVRIWDVRTKQVKVLKVLKGHSDVVNSVSFSPDGLQLITGSDDKTARIWNANTEDFKALDAHTGYVSSVMFNFDGSRVVTASRDKSARIWDASTGMPLGKLLNEHKDTVNFAAFSPNGSQVVTASDDGTFKIWDAHSFKVVRNFPAQDDLIHSAVFSPDGTLVLTASTDIVKAWNAKTRVEAFHLPHHTEVWFAEFNRDGSNVVTAGADNLVRIWDVKNQKEPKVTLTGHTDLVYFASFSPDGLRVVSASADKTVRIWNCHTGAVTVLRGHEGKVYSAAFSGDGKRVVTASADHTIRVWNAETGLLEGMLDGHLDEVNGAVFSPDGSHIASASNDKTARIWLTLKVTDPLRGACDWLKKNGTDLRGLASQYVGQKIEPICGSHAPREIDLNQLKE